jgi:hypothetical protein
VFVMCVGKIILKFTQNHSMAYTPCWQLSLFFIVEGKSLSR